MFSSEHCFDENTTQELLSYNEKQWFHNGRSISVTNNFKYNSSLHFRPNSPVKSTFVVTDVSRSDLGDYLGIISTNTYDMLSWCTEYLSFIPYFYWRFLFGSQSFPVTVMYSSVQLYGKYYYSDLITNCLSIYILEGFFIYKGLMCV